MILPRSPSRATITSSTGGSFARSKRRCPDASVTHGGSHSPVLGRGASAGAADALEDGARRGLGGESSLAAVVALGLAVAEGAIRGKGALSSPRADESKSAGLE